MRNRAEEIISAEEGTLHKNIYPPMSTKMRKALSAIKSKAIMTIWHTKILNQRSVEN
jgi:hypothetical protein